VERYHRMGERQMFTTKVAGAAALLVVLGGAAACGSSDSSAPSASAGGPTDADQTSFCSTFQKLSDTTTPKDASAAFAKVGTPSDISPEARHGYEVLVSKLSTMADDSKSSDLEAMQKSLSAADQKDVVAFVTYLTKECVGGVPSAPSS
jgi:hypothetical protein